MANAEDVIRWFFRSAAYLAQVRERGMRVVERPGSWMALHGHELTLDVLGQLLLGRALEKRSDALEAFQDAFIDADYWREREARGHEALSEASGHLRVDLEDLRALRDWNAHASTADIAAWLVFASLS